MAQHGSIWLNMAQHGSTWLNMAQHGSTWLNMPPYGTALTYIRNAGYIWLHIIYRQNMLSHKRYSDMLLLAARATISALSRNCVGAGVRAASH
jgi:hypothetical protein